MANLVDALGSWRRAREFRRDQAARLSEREIAAKERIAAALDEANRLKRLEIEATAGRSE